jgi:hypothetical protein
MLLDPVLAEREVLDVLVELAVDIGDNIARAPQVSTGM